MKRIKKYWTPFNIVFSLLVFISHGFAASEESTSALECSYYGLEANGTHSLLVSNKRDFILRTRTPIRNAYPVQYPYGPSKRYTSFIDMDYIVLGKARFEDGQVGIVLKSNFNRIDKRIDKVWNVHNIYDENRLSFFQPIENLKKYENYPAMAILLEDNLRENVVSKLVSFGLDVSQFPKVSLSREQFPVDYRCPNLSEFKSKLAQVSELSDFETKVVKQLYNRVKSGQSI